MNIYPITFRLKDEAEVEALNEWAREEKRSRSSLLRWLILREVERRAREKATGERAERVA